MSVNFCQHVKVDGTLCQVPPLDGRHYCHFHLGIRGQRARMARARARREAYHLVLPILEDLNSVLVARQQVMDALNAGLVTARQAGVLLFGLQGIAGDLHSDKAPRLGMYDPAIDTAPRATDYPNFEENHGLPKDLDLSRPPEVLFAAEAVAAAITQAEPSPYRSDLFRTDYISPEDVELEEVLKNEGEPAYQQRMREQTQKAMHQANQRRREIKRAQYVVEAARRNQEILMGTPEERARTNAEIERMRAEAAAATQAGKKPSSAISDDGIVGMGHLPSAENGELGKKPTATAPLAEADPEAAKKEELARQIAALEQRWKSAKA
jgi:hypothetical protein